MTDPKSFEWFEETSTYAGRAREACRVLDGLACGVFLLTRP